MRRNATAPVLASDRVTFRENGVPYVCVPCRRAFKRSRPVFLWGDDRRPCPRCAGPALAVSSKFKTPSAADEKQWAKVAFLLEHGFRFYSAWDPVTQTDVDYPTSLVEAREWVKQWSHLPPLHGGPVSA